MNIMIGLKVFKPKVSDNINCVCKCDLKLNEYIKSCDFKTRSILRKIKATHGSAT